MLWIPILIDFLKNYNEKIRIPVNGRTKLKYNLNKIYVTKLRSLMIYDPTKFRYNLTKLQCLT